jgi:hypothetical protein
LRVPDFLPAPRNWSKSVRFIVFKVPLIAIGSIEDCQLRIANSSESFRIQIGNWQLANVDAT